MLNTLFSGIFSSTTETIAVPQFLLGIAVALVIGIFLAIHTKPNTQRALLLLLHFYLP